jgi:hypothetical protein
MKKEWDGPIEGMATNSLSLYQIYKVEERKYEDKPLDFINKFCFRYEHN